MSASVRNPADAELVRQAEGHGCLTPTFTRDTAPTAWTAWERRATDVIMGAAREADMAPLCAAADKFIGRDVEHKPVFEPINHQVRQLMQAAFGSMAR